MADLFDDRVECGTEEKGSERVSLVCSSTTIDNDVTELEVGKSAVAGFNPSRESQEVLTNLSEEVGSIKSVESVLNIELEEDVDLIRKVRVIEG